MVFHENRLLANDSHDISYLFILIRKDVAKFVVYTAFVIGALGVSKSGTVSDVYFFMLSSTEHGILTTHIKTNIL